jgi:hypothetical protein
MINSHKYTKEYYLADGIYPRLTTFLNTILDPTSGKRDCFSQCQEACGKDVERAFDVHQARFSIVRFPTLTWSKDQTTDVPA